MDKRKANSERNQLLRRFESFFELPMVVLGFIWLALLIIELVHETSPVLETFGLIIWGIFITDFLIKFFLATDKPLFLKRNILTLVSLIVPAFRILRQVADATGGRVRVWRSTHFGGHRFALEVVALDVPAFAPVLEAVRLDTPVGERGSMLSGGQSPI